MKNLTSVPALATSLPLCFGAALRQDSPKTLPVRVLLNHGFALVLAAHLYLMQTGVVVDLEFR